MTAPTHKVLQERMARARTNMPRFFDPKGFATLQAVCGRLFPPQADVVQIDIAGQIDSALAQSEGDGWRYDAMPPDSDAHRLGLEGIEQTANALFNKSFVQLSGSQQNTVLSVVQQGTALGTQWLTVPSTIFFEELLALATGFFYAHPLVQESIGYAGMADAPGWHLIGLNQLEAREPGLLPDQND